MSIEIDHGSGVSWGAIFAGAACAAALSFILLILGFGLGLSAISPWSNTGATMAAIGVASVIWVAFTQIVASGLGGYLAGRLRVRWPGVHVDEVYFRDTAHGLITWAVSTLFAAVLLTSTLMTVMGAGVRAGAEATGSVVEGAADMMSDAAATPENYFTDSLLRATTGPGFERPDDATRTELATIFANSLATGSFTNEDMQYTASVISRYTGLSQNEAQNRVTQVFQAAQEAEVRAREAADTARRAVRTSALWMFIALLMGAFVASLMAMYGGRQRDTVTYP